MREANARQDEASDSGRATSASCLSYLCPGQTIKLGELFVGENPPSWRTWNLPGIARDCDGQRQPLAVHFSRCCESTGRDVATARITAGERIHKSARLNIFARGTAGTETHSLHRDENNSGENCWKFLEVGRTRWNRIIHLDIPLFASDIFCRWNVRVMDEICNDVKNA